MTSTSAFTCPKCNYRFRVKEKYLGQIAECPAAGCVQKMRLNPPLPAATQTDDSQPPTAPETVDAAAVSRQPSREAETQPIVVQRMPAASRPQPSKAVSDDSASNVAAAEFIEDPVVIDGSDGDLDSVISVVALSPSESRRTQRVLRRRATAAPPKAVVTKKAIDPTWIGFGSVIAIAVIGWTIWLMVAEPTEIETRAPAAEDLPTMPGESVDGNEDAADQVFVPRQEPIFASFPFQNGDAPRAQLEEKVLPYLNKYCADCHGPDSAEAGIDIDKLKASGDFFDQRKSWERVYRMIEAGAMPPSDYDPRPSLAEQADMAALLNDELFNFDCDLVYNPGRPAVQRLNKAEYNNTIRDMFGLKITPADDFPADDVGEGFDNIGDVLSLPPLLLEKYLNAAETVANAVIDTRDFSRPMLFEPDGPLLNTMKEKYENDGFLTLYTNGEVIGKFDVPVSGEYEIRTEVKADQAGDEKARFAFKVDNKSAKEQQALKHKRPETFSHKVRLESGKREVAIAFLNDKTVNDGPEDRRDRNLGVRSIQLLGPFGGGQPVRTEIHRRFVTASPGKGVSVEQAAAKVLRPILQKAFRRQVNPAEVTRYSRLVKTAVEQQGEAYEVGLSLGLQAILVSPDFLFRLEDDPPASQQERRLGDFEVASRLSYFLWSSMPDDELFRLAAKKQLTNPKVLVQQVRRMLQDEKSAALVTNFASQWLNLRNLADVTPNTDVFKSFNDKLRDDMQRETELLFETIMRDDRSVEDLLSADFTFVNKRLAKHYGIEGINSDKFERVSLKDTNRSGVLTHASILTLTSNPGRTSPVKRGKWIMENIFGEAPPPPPPGVPELEETAKAAPDASLREQLAKHREDPGCAACHKVMDPLGLGLENFDAIGQWRTKDDGRDIDASGTLPGGESFDGPLQMLKIVQANRKKFLRTLSDKMLTYAIGRGTMYYDKCAVDKCLNYMNRNENRFSALIESIVLSDPFLKRGAPQKSSEAL